jgi:hypothetical protein
MWMLTALRTRQTFNSNSGSDAAPKLSEKASGQIPPENPVAKIRKPKKKRKDTTGGADDSDGAAPGVVVDNDRTA